MTLQLDARQRAMLEEMGIRLFQPLPSPEPAQPVPVAPPAVRLQPTPAARSPDPAPVPVVRAPVAQPIAPPAMRPAAQPDARSAGETDTPAIEMMEWDALAQAVIACRACQLCEGRREPLLGAGDVHADWLIVGEPPNEDEDRAGEPFQGDGGRLLDNMLKALGLGRGDRVYLANILKCRPPGTGMPGPDEVARCEPFLRRQIALLQPKVILAMGRLAAQTLVASTEPLGKVRGRVHSYHGIPVVATYHPMYLLRNPADKARAWADLCLAQAIVQG